MSNKIKMANYFRQIARYGLLVLGVFVFFFALFSGARGYGGGIEGIMLNSPNALPWLILLLFLLIPVFRTGHQKLCNYLIFKSSFSKLGAAKQISWCLSGKIRIEAVVIVFKLSPKIVEDTKC